jgi:hypothetical protein
MRFRFRGFSFLNITKVIFTTIFGITGCNHGKEVFLSESLCGYNAIAVTGDSPDIISKAIQDRLGISEENILVCMIGKQ